MTLPPPESPPGDSVLDEIRRSAAALLGLARTRIELFAVELQEEKLRLIRLLIWIALGLSLLFAGVLVAIGTLALFLWQSAGYAGLLLLAAGIMAMGGGLLWALRRHLKVAALPFPETTAEFGRDAESLRQK